MSFIVAIDGPAGSGKGTVAKLISKDLSFVNIDTGATFRCVALAMLQKNIKKEEEKEIEKILKNIKKEEEKEIEKILKNIKIDMKADGTILLNNEVVTDRIRENDVNELVSPISTIKIVREKLLEIQRNIASGKNVVMEGRDIGTVVFPEADVKIYLDASAEERARRRLKQNKEKGIESSYEEVLQNIKDRDKRDSSREIAPLKKAEDAILIDSTNLEINEVVKAIEEIIEKVR